MEKREKIYHKLLRVIVDLPMDATEETDGINVEQYIEDKINGNHEPQTKKIEIEQPSNYPQKSLKLK